MKHANDNCRPLRFISMFSGIEAASVAFGPLGWEAICFAEIEKFPSAVLAHRYPDIPNVGDMTAHDWSQYRGSVDIVCGGPPCQAFSVAGLRKSMADARGNLSLAYMRALHAIKPRNAIVENVPGWLNTKDNAFGCFLAGIVGADAPLVSTHKRGRWPDAGMVDGPKGRAAWRIQDAQFHGLAQRRRRVIVVADFGNGADPAAVLFEPEGVFRHSPPSRETGEGVAHATGISTAVSSGQGWWDQKDIGATVRAQDSVTKADTLVAYAPEIARCDATREGSSQDYESTTMVAVTPINSMLATRHKAMGERTGLGIGREGEPSFTITKEHHHAVCVTGSVTHTLKAEGADASEDGTGRGTPIIAQSVALRGRKGGATAELGGEVATALRASAGGGDKPHVLAFNARQDPTHGPVADALGTRDTGHGVHVGSAVRRLTPVECERLQGFPDNYTAIPWRGKPADQCPDGPRYKALGNSWAVPLFAWLGSRIDGHMPPQAAPANDNTNRKESHDAAA